MTQDNAWEEQQQAREQELKPLLTDEFLATLTRAARTCGWSVDYAEAADFVWWCYDLAGKPRPPEPEMDPFNPV